MARILSQEPTCPVAVHGYQLTDKQVAMLRRGGVAVAQRLCTELFCKLCRAARRSVTTVYPDETQADVAPTEETWISLES